MSGLSDDQIRYLRDVLGIESVILGEGAAAVAQQPTPPPAPISESRLKGHLKSARLLVVSAGEHRFALEGEAGELANKMIQAMKLKPDDVAVLEWTSAVPEDVRDAWNDWDGIALSFGELAAAQLTGSPSLSGSWLDAGSRRIMVTDAPSRLLAEPERKKIAWAHLQQVMKALS
jgi:hypothetical protein